MSARILIVDDDTAVATVLRGLLGQAGHDAHTVSSAPAALAYAESHAVDLVLTDLRMPEMDGMELLRRLKQSAPDLPVIMLTAHGSIERAVEAMQAGAADFLTKPFKRDEVVFSVDKALTAGSHGDRPPPLSGGGLLLGSSPAMREVTDVIARAARSNAHVLIRGESGTGKELAARSVHQASPRAAGPFVAVNCAALPDQLLESELFGYEKGAFTGAATKKPGRVALAEGGTLLLDEIGDVSPAVQVKLLRLLQQKEYEPLGATATVRADVRFIAATHQDLEGMVETGAFREDLYYRLNVVPIFMPPLREHKDDIAELARQLCARLANDNGRATLTLDATALDALAEHDWPGNVRELVNFIERLVVFCDGTSIGASDVVRELGRSPRPRAGVGGSTTADSQPDHGAGLKDRRQQAERDAIREALGKAGGNRTQAARLLGISRRTLYKRLDALAMSDV